MHIIANAGTKAMSEWLLRRLWLEEKLDDFYKKNGNKLESCIVWIARGDIPQ